jgi:hypothetical protein
LAASWYSLHLPFDFRPLLPSHLLRLLSSPFMSSHFI